MELYREILTNVLANQEVQVTFPGLGLDAAQIVEGVCYQTLLRIKEIIVDDSLEDSVCFDTIEEIVCAFEAIGSNGGVRHDFG